MVRCVRAQTVAAHPGVAGVAQLVEHLICNQRVGGSNPSAGSKNSITYKLIRGLCNGIGSNDDSNGEARSVQYRVYPIWPPLATFRADHLLTEGNDGVG